MNGDLDMNEERRIYITQINSLLDEWSAHVSVIKSKVANRTIEVSRSYHSYLSIWYEKKAKLRLKLDEMESGDINTFETMRFHAQQVRSDAQAAYVAVTKC